MNSKGLSAEAASLVALTVVPRAVSRFEEWSDGVTDHPLKVYDISGRLMVDAPHADGTWTMPAQGVYILRVGNQPAKKVVLIR